MQHNVFNFYYTNLLTHDQVFEIQINHFTDISHILLFFCFFTDTTEITTPQTTANMETSTSARQTSTSPSAILPTILTASSTTSRVSTSGTTEDTSTFLSKATKTPRKKPKMPRVTLKLRENETIPHMYMKAGIASYKKGNITTSVLASDLSLEGLIFKTPEGTIRPWSQKWFFSDPAANFQWKVSASAIF